MTRIFEDGFESNALLKTDVPAGAWDAKTQVNGTVAVSSVQKFLGDYSELVTITASNGRAGVKKIFSTSHLFHRHYVCFNDLPPNGTYFWSQAIDAGVCPGIMSRVGIYYDGVTYYWVLSYYDTAQHEIFYSEIQPTIGMWYCLQTELLQGASNNGAVNVWLGNTQILSVVGITNNWAIDQIWGYLSVTGNIFSNVSLYIDAVVASDQYIEPEISNRISRVAVQRRGIP